MSCRPTCLTHPLRSNSNLSRSLDLRADPVDKGHKVGDDNEGEDHGQHEHADVARDLRGGPCVQGAHP